MARLTPEQAAKKSTLSVRSQLTDIDEFLSTATVAELQEYLHWLDIREARHWFERARAELDVRLAVQVAEHTKQIVAHTDKLNNQTSLLVRESKSLRLLTWGLLIFTIALVVSDCRKEANSVQSVTAAVAVTNAPVYNAVTNGPATPH